MISSFAFQVFINFARQQTDETVYDDKSLSPGRTGSRFRVRRRAERLRDIWSDEVRFSALEDEDGEPGVGDDEDWQVTFSDRVSTGTCACAVYSCILMEGVFVSGPVGYKGVRYRALLRLILDNCSFYGSLFHSLLPL